VLKARWAGLICRAHQHYDQQWGQTLSSQILGDKSEEGKYGYERKDFEKATVVNATRNVNNRSIGSEHDDGEELGDVSDW